MNLSEIYKNLLSEFGHQEWWPANRNFKPVEWEICVGAILTQNTNWKNVEKALDNLSTEGIISPQKTIDIGIKNLEQIIRPSGFYKQKAERLKILAELVLSFQTFENFKKSVAREQLLETKGIGPETADSILLYACGRPYFVIDAYTKRLAKAFNLPVPQEYASLQFFFESSIKKDTELYKEFHALIVEWGKNVKKSHFKTPAKSHH